jgi:geranylgeranyl transferase type-2 subunit beta
MIKYVLSCQTEEGSIYVDEVLSIGGFGAHSGHDAHLIYTCSAVQILAIQDALDSLDAEEVINCTSYLLYADTRHNFTAK